MYIYEANNLPIIMILFFICHLFLTFRTASKDSLRIYGDLETEYICFRGVCIGLEIFYRVDLTCSRPKDLSKCYQNLDHEFFSFISYLL